jgi:hypothetical protein
VISEAILADVRRCDASTGGQGIHRHFFLTFASYEFIPRALFTALIRSSILTTSGSHFTAASFASNETVTSFTPFTASSADCTVDAQEPQVMPLISSVTVASLAAAETGNIRAATDSVRTVNTLRLFIYSSSRRIARLFFVSELRLPF